MTAIYEKLICSCCKKYLSVFPIKVYPNRQVECGRCNSDDDQGTVSVLYETIAKELKFPCINSYEGCKKLLEYSEVSQHEFFCIGTSIKCPICYDFEGHSFTISEHFKQKHPENYLKHPEFLISFDYKNEEKFYLFSDCLNYSFGIVCVRYDHVVNKLYLDIAPIYIETEDEKNLKLKFELYSINNKLMFNSKSDKRCVRYLKYTGANLNNGFVRVCSGVFIKGKYPDDKAICKFYITEEEKICFTEGLILKKGPVVSKSEAEPKIIVKEVIKEVYQKCNLQHFPAQIKLTCTLPHYPAMPTIVKEIKEVPKPCNLQHYPIEPVTLQNDLPDPVMQIHIDNHGTQSISYFFPNIRSLQNHKVFSPIFYMANTSWKMYIKKHYKQNTPYLSLYLCKVEIGDENDCSYKVNAKMSVVSVDEKSAIDNTFNDIIFGQRQNEVMEKGWEDFMAWNNLADRNKKYICKTDGDTQVKIIMTLAKIFEHKSSCRCPACKKN